MTLDASFPAVVELSGLLALHGRTVLLHSLAAPVCKGCKRQEGVARNKGQGKRSFIVLKRCEVLQQMRTQRGKTLGNTWKPRTEGFLMAGR